MSSAAGMTFRSLPVAIVMLVALIARGCGGSPAEPSVTSVYTVRNGAASSFPAATRAEAFELFEKLRAAEDQAAIQRMFDRGDLIEVPAGTRVRIPRMGILTNEISPVSGELQGKRLWMSYAHLDLDEEGRVPLGTSSGGLRGGETEDGNPVSSRGPGF
ncbi:MAG: hypothetical protein RL885_33195 [Planctomycetota bacterium]